MTPIKLGKPTADFNGRDITSADTVITFDRGKELGKGGYSHVYMGTIKHDQKVQQQVAVKRFLRSEIENLETREEDAMKSLNHENVLKLLFVINENEDFK